jgi:RNA polymerase sigma-70 factor (ECF subfamily)
MWMAAAQTGDMAAYRRLLVDVAPVIRGKVRQRWGYADGAEDVVQDVLMSVHEARHTYDPARPFAPWLLAVLNNRMADAARRQMRKAAVETAVETVPEPEGTGHAAVADEGMVDVEGLRLAIAGLPASQQQAVELLKLKELSLREASAVSGQSVAALKVATHRALKALRLILGGGKAG